MHNYSKSDVSREAEDLILGLNSKLFEGAYSGGSSYKAPSIHNEYITEDQKFKQYNEALSPNLAKAILGDEYNSRGSNYHMCTDLTGTYITYDYNGEEFSIKLEREEDAYIENDIRNELIHTEQKKPKFKLRYIFVGLLGLCVLATIGLIFLWLV